MLFRSLTDARIIKIPNRHQNIRIKKSQKEIELIKKSQKLNMDAFKKFGEFIEKNGTGMSEFELHRFAKKFLESDGKYELSFNPIVAIAKNGAKPHSLPSKSDILKVGDSLLFDAGIKYERYCSDRTRTALFDGDIDFENSKKFIDEKKEDIKKIVNEAKSECIEKIRAGMSGGEVDSIARGVIEKYGYGEYFIHSTGHGIGLDIHELPRISKTSTTEIEDGMVFSVEPGIYIGGFFGVRLEDLVVIKNGRAEII